MAQSSANIATSNLFADIADAPAVQALARRLEDGGALSFSGIAVPAWPFLAALFRQHFPQRPIVVVTDNLKAQEIFQADLETWLNGDGGENPSKSGVLDRLSRGWWTDRSHAGLAQW